MLIMPLSNNPAVTHSLLDPSPAQAVEEISKQDQTAISARPPMPIITQEEMKMHLDRLFMEELFKEEIERVTRWDLVPEVDDPMVQEILNELQGSEAVH
ncbi:hypothetical protein [Magnetococcus sp. PR-3]|uniref:hypothetical protein n=1 Tax=Magnetococcus sp. PR-3 TaxID=3120355 RepID=UPI002FCE04CA